MRQSPSSLSSRSGSLTPNQSRGPTFSPGPYSASPDPVCLINLIHSIFLIYVPGMVEY